MMMGEPSDKAASLNILENMPDGKVAHFCQRTGMKEAKQTMEEAAGYVKSDFCFQDMLEQLTESMAGQWRQKQQNFTISISQDMPAAIVADRHRLMQVITHLLDNAHKFTPEGGNIALYCMKTSDDGQRCKLLIEVEDDGVGIPEEQRKHIFGAFEQANNAITHQYGGTGLGLATSRNIVRAMGGEIWAEARPDKGSVIGFTIEAGIGEAALNRPVELVPPTQ